MVDAAVFRHPVLVAGFPAGLHRHRELGAEPLPGEDGLVRSIFGIIVFFSVIGTGVKVYRNLGRTRLPARMMTTNGA
jgi:hypothetical protein